MIGRFRRARRAPLAVAGILATPLFFVALMAFALRLEEPSVQIAANGVRTVGDPLGSTVATIYLLSFGVSAVVVLVGVGAMLLPGRVGGVVVSALSAIVTTIALVVPLDTWAAEHTARYPLGVDLIPRRSVEDLMLRGEWEENARRTAQELGFWTIVIAVTAIAIAATMEIRRRRGLAGPPAPPPPPELSLPS